MMESVDKYVGKVIWGIYNMIFPSPELKEFRRERDRALSLVRNSNPENLWENYRRAKIIAFNAFSNASSAGLTHRDGGEIDPRLASSLFNGFYLFPEFVGEKSWRARRRFDESVILSVKEAEEKLEAMLN